MRATDAGVRKAESEIDRFFEESLPVREIWLPPVAEALLEKAELLVTGHRSESRKYWPAIRSLYLNVCSGLSTSLRFASKVCAAERTTVPAKLDVLATDCIALAMMYNALEDAFYGYWKSYATALFPEDHVVQFIPTGGELDARLRCYSSEDGLQPARAEFHDPLDPEEPLAKEFVDSLIANSELKREGGFTYSIDTKIINGVADAHHTFLIQTLGEVPDIRVGVFCLDDLLRGWSVVLAVCRIHRLVSILLAKDPTDFSTSVNWPALYRQRAEWLRWFASVPHAEEVFRALTFDQNDKNADVAVTPIVPIGEDWFGCVPSITLSANVPRNVYVLLASRFSDAYSAYSRTKEEILLDSFAKEFPGLFMGARIVLPEYKDRRLPDIDLLVRGEQPESIIVAEVKWQLSASSTKEVISRNEYLRKGQEQLSRIRSFLAENPNYLRGRGLVPFETQIERIKFLLLTKGHLGCEDVISPDTLMADYDVCTEYLRLHGLASTLEKLAAFDYLPVPGKDFRLADVKMKFGDWVIVWKKIEAGELPPDEETDALEEFYLRAARYLDHR